MTSDEIDRLEAGRDADTLLAELIALPGVQLECVPWEPGRRRPYWRHAGAGYREKFQPTNDPAAAAVVLQWLCRLGQSNEPQSERARALCAGLKDASEIVICKAALLAVTGSPVKAGMREQIVSQ